MKTSIATLAVLVGAIAAAPAMATNLSRFSGQTETHKVRVHYADLNLGTASGAEQLYRRISFAAHEVCGDVTVPSFVNQNRAYRECRRTAVEDAVAKVDRPKLTALYDRHFPDNPLVASKPNGRGAGAVG
ncbi:MAG TPA: UrcA family protein [Gammaproteobacteria bacterium]|nr:UrcA family protein [Gammaproteobacteria bacterium]